MSENDPKAMVEKKVKFKPTYVPKKLYKNWEKSPFNVAPYDMAKILQDPPTEGIKIWPNRYLMIIEVRSAGFEGGNKASISVNGKIVQVEKNSNGHFRGLHIVVIDPDNGKIVLAKAFDTHATTLGIKEMLDGGGAPEGFIVIAACQEECVKKMTQKIKKWFTDMGSSEIWNIQHRQAFAFIGIADRCEPHEVRGISLKEPVVLS